MRRRSDFAGRFRLHRRRKQAFEAQLLLDDGQQRKAEELAYGAMLQAAKTLVQIQWQDAPTDPDSVVNEFRNRYVETKIFWDPYHAGQFANYLFARHSEGPDSRYTTETVHKLIEETNLFIDAAHKAHAKYRQSLNVLTPA